MKKLTSAIFHSTHNTKVSHNVAASSAPSVKHSYSLEDSLQLLGLNDGPEEGTSDPIISRGAYLSLIYLRHLKLRHLQVQWIIMT